MARMWQQSVTAARLTLNLWHTSHASVRYTVPCFSTTMPEPPYCIAVQLVVPLKLCYLTNRMVLQVINQRSCLVDVQVDFSIRGKLRTDVDV